MAEKTKQTKKAKETKTEEVNCKDRLCPTHGKNPLKLRGKIFTGTVVKKLPGRATIEFERILKINKYERYEKRKTKLQARLPDCMSESVNVGDLIEIAETRPISKTIHTVVTKVIKEKGQWRQYHLNLQEV